MNQEWMQYAESHTSAESDLLSELRELCYSKFSNSSMLSGFYQGRLLSMISRMLRPKTVLEVGTYLGYSALCLAEGLDDLGKVITIDIQEETTQIAREFAARGAFGDRIDFRLGNALEIIPQINETIDLAFIDADKLNYGKYYELILPKLRCGGFIIADNVLWSGKVLDPGHDPNALALAEFNEMINSDPRTENLLLPVRDGLLIVRKL
ncbi:MAG: methyltransferase [Blastocatellia bacterium]